MFNSSDPRESYLFMKWMVENKAADLASLTTSFLRTPKTSTGIGTIPPSLRWWITC